MKNVKIVFYKNAIVEDPLHFYDALQQKITIQDLKDAKVHILYEEAMPASLSIDVIQSQIVLIEEYHGNFSSLKENLFIDKHSKLTRIGLYLDVISSMEMYREIKNEGYYHNIQLDVSDASTFIEEKVDLIHPDSTCLAHYAIYGQNRNQKTYQTNILHSIFSTQSDCKIYGICNDFAQLTLATDAYIIKGASHSKAKQEGRIINLTANSKGLIYPDLHIDENDVEAAHSCIVGSVNLDDLYYLQRRGFSQQEGKNLLIKSYFTPIFQFIEDEVLKDKMQLAIQKRIG